LQKATILDRQGTSSDWENYEKMKVQLAEPITLATEKWALVYSAGRDYDNANALLDNFRKASNAFGIRV
jgi:hypothetical protein